MSLNLHLLVCKAGVTACGHQEVDATQYNTFVSKEIRRNIDVDRNKENLINYLV